LSAHWKSNGASPMFSIVIEVDNASSSVTRIVARKGCGQSARVTCVSVVRSSAYAAPLGSLDVSTISHIAPLRNPFVGKRPMEPNCGKMTGMPPRIGSPGATGAFALMNNISTPFARFHEVTCAPRREISAVAPEKCRRVTESRVRVEASAGGEGAGAGGGAG